MLQQVQFLREFNPVGAPTTRNSKHRSQSLSRNCNHSLTFTYPHQNLQKIYKPLLNKVTENSDSAETFSFPIEIQLKLEHFIY